MPLRPFPSSLNIGIDICSIRRIDRVLLKEPPKLNIRFLKRLFTPQEFASFCHTFLRDKAGRHETYQELSENGLNYVAGRWAAKEACIKAVKPRRLTFQHVFIHPEIGSAPTCIVLDEMGAKHRATHTEDQSQKPHMHDSIGTAKESDSSFSLDQLNGQLVKLSISHDDGYATAVVLAPEINEVSTEPAQIVPNIRRVESKVKSRRA